MKSAVSPAADVPAFFSTDVSAARRFYLDLNPQTTRGVTVVCGGFEHCAPNYAIERQGFAYLSVEFIARGKGMAMLNGKPFELSVGTVFSYGPRVPHRMETDAGDPLKKYFLDVVGKGAERMLAMASVPPGACVQVSMPNQVQEIFEDLIRNGVAHSPLSARICATLFEYLTLKIAETAIAHGSANSRAFVAYERCRQFIEEHFLEVRNLEDVAAGCSVDKAYLCRLFQKFDHQTPYQKLRKLQMNYAADRLQHSGQLVKQVADELGLDPFHFSRVFKQVCGVSPEGFLKAARR